MKDKFIDPRDFHPKLEAKPSLPQEIRKQRYIDAMVQKLIWAFGDKDKLTASRLRQRDRMIGEVKAALKARDIPEEEIAGVLGADPKKIDKPTRVFSPSSQKDSGPIFKSTRQKGFYLSEEDMRVRRSDVHEDAKYFGKVHKTNKRET